MAQAAWGQMEGNAQPVPAGQPGPMPEQPSISLSAQAELELELSLRGSLLVQQQRRIVQLEDELQRAWAEIDRLRTKIAAVERERQRSDDDAAKQVRLRAADGRWPTEPCIPPPPPSPKQRSPNPCGPIIPSASPRYAWAEALLRRSPPLPSPQPLRRRSLLPCCPRPHPRPGSAGAASRFGRPHRPLHSASCPLSPAPFGPVAAEILDPRGAPAVYGRRAAIRLEGRQIDRAARWYAHADAGPDARAEALPPSAEGADRCARVVGVRVRVRNRVRVRVRVSGTPAAWGRWPW